MKFFIQPNDTRQVARAKLLYLIPVGFVINMLIIMGEFAQMIIDEFGELKNATVEAWNHEQAQ